MGKYKSYIFGLILSLVIFAASLTAFLVLSNRTKNGEIDFKDIPTNQRENIKVANKSYQLNGLDIFQQDFNYYDLYITFLDENDDIYEDVTFYISKMAEDLNESTKINATLNVNKVYKVENFYIPSRGDYFLTAKFKVNGLDNEAVLPIAFPKMNPKIYINNGLNNLMFEIDGKTSWSSFIDPEGINLYRSSDYTFNENANIIEENLRIITYQYLDLNSTPLEPYYFLKLSSKEGRVNFYTRCLFSTVTQEDFKARFLHDTTTDTMYLEFTGSIKGPEKDNNLATRDIRLRVGNWPVTTMVENSYRGDDNSRYKFLINLKDKNLVKVGPNDLVIYYIENGTMLEASINTNPFDINPISNKYDGYKVYLSRPTALQINKDYDLTVSNLIANFVKEGEVVYLVFSGLVYFQNPLAITKMSLYVQNLGSTEAEILPDGSFKVKVDLTNLPISSHWNDLRFSFTEGENKFMDIDLRSSLITKGSPLVDGNVTYQFESWNDLLKLHKHR